MFFSRLNKKKLAAKKTKKPSESLENCTTSDAGIFNAHFLLLFKNKNKKWKKKQEKMKKKNGKNPTKRKASSVTPIWRPLGQGSSLASLRTTFDTWLPPDPLKPP